MSEIIKMRKFVEKDCPDWEPLEDGTKTGDPIYCKWSLQCKQIDVNAVGYISNWHKFRDEDTGEELFDYFCTGIYPAEPEDKEDKEIS